jgi:hypothetical protein
MRNYFLAKSSLSFSSGCTGLYSFFPDVSIPELIKCLLGLIDRQLVSGAALKYEDGDAYLSFQGLVLTADGCTYAQQLARGRAEKNNIWSPR